MKELEVLLNKRWVLKSRDKEMYYKIRDALGELRKFTTEKMGCQIIDNSLLIKMEKIPVIPESFMGIQKFSSKEEYAYLCILLMFLEDRDAQEHPVTADGIYHGKPAGRNFGLDFVYEPKKTDPCAAICGRSGNG